jgi:MFS family permease
MKKGLRYFKYNTKKMFPAFRHKSYRLFWTGQGVSLSGTWMQTTAQAWLVYELTGSPFLLGLIGALEFTPVMLFSLFAGVYLDRYPKKQLILITQSVSMLLAAILTILVLTDTVQFWHIATISVLMGFVRTLDMPTRQSFMMELVGRHHLTSAIALNSVTFNLARIVGPGIGGFLIAKAGIGMCFLINTVSYLAVLISVYFIVPRTIEAGKSVNKAVMAEIREGLRYIKGKVILSRPIIVLGIVSLFAINFNILVPVLAKSVLGTNAQGFGYLLSALGLGSIIGALTVASFSHKLDRGKLIRYGPYALSFAMIFVGLSLNFGMAVFFLILLGISNLLFFTTVNSTLQLNSDPQFRGRVMSVYTMVFGGVTPFGNLFAGWVSGTWGGRAGFVISAAVTIILVFILRYYIREKKEVPA